ncbi:MAG: DMT family transporter [Pseudomonadota bacterium]
MATLDASSGSTPARLPATGFLMLASLGLFWGLNWPGMKIVLGEVTVWWFRSMSVSVGGIGLLTIAAVTGLRLVPRRAELGPLVVCTVCSILGWHLCSGYGVSLMEAGRASIIAFTMPVWAAIFATWVLGERLTVHKIAGLSLGVAGLAVLIGPDAAALGAAPLGAVFMLGAAVTWAMGTVLFKKFSWTSPVATLIGWQLLLGGGVITVGALAWEPLPDPGTWSTQVWWALAYLFAVPMIYCQWAYFYVVKIFPAAIAAIGTLAVPVVGVFSSALILGEPLGWQEFTAMGLICTALFVVLVLPALRVKGA